MTHHDPKAVDRAARALWARSGATRPYDQLSAAARKELRAEVVCVLDNLAPSETIRIEPAGRNRWHLVRTLRNGGQERVPCVAGSKRTAAEIAFRMWPLAEMAA